MDKPCVYEIRVEGHLTDRWSDWFDGLAIHNDLNGEATLSGRLTDQAALFGVLAKIYNLNLTPISVYRSPLRAKGRQPRNIARHAVDRMTAGLVSHGVIHRRATTFIAPVSFCTTLSNGLMSFNSRGHLAEWRVPTISRSNWQRSPRQSSAPTNPSASDVWAIEQDASRLAEHWHTHSIVRTVDDENRVPPGMQDCARDYVELHELQADFILSHESIEVLLKITQERQIDLVLMGGYSVSALEEVVIGSMVNYLLRETHIPLSICR